MRATPRRGSPPSRILTELEIAESNKELESFTSAAGHDLRGPLRILKGFSEALDDECGETLNDEGKTFLKEIIKASDRMEGLIDGMLAMSRAGRAEMSCENLDLTTLVELVYYELRHAETERHVQCEVAPDITAWGDVRLMMTVLRNLLGNAWKFTGRTASPRTFRCGATFRRTWYCVGDNGAGSMARRAPVRRYRLRRMNFRGTDSVSRRCCAS